MLIVAFMFHTTFIETNTYSLEDSLNKFSSYFANKLVRFSFSTLCNAASMYFQRVCSVLAFSSRKHLKQFLCSCVRFILFLLLLSAPLSVCFTIIIWNNLMLQLSLLCT